MQMRLRVKPYELECQVDDGGHYAIKGFLYQFDKTIEEILSNPRKVVHFEQSQDIDYEDHCIQVKIKGSQNFAPSKIRKAVLGLIQTFDPNKPRNLRLYCHFRDKLPGVSQPLPDELRTILGGGSQLLVPSDLLDEFSRHFWIEFADDYEGQFKRLLTKIKEKMKLKTDDEALVRHALIRSYLLDKTVGPVKNRHVHLDELVTMVESKTKIICWNGYERILESRQYVRLVKNEYFTVKSVNLDPLERLFIFDFGEHCSATNMASVARAVRNKFYIRPSAPSPSVYYRNIDSRKLNKLKNELHEMMKADGERFNDGTLFDGHRFDAQVFSENKGGIHGQLRLVPAQWMRSGANFLATRFKQVYDLHRGEPMKFKRALRFNFYIRIPIDSHEQAIAMLGAS
jgi:hypothetical protein